MSRLSIEINKRRGHFDLACQIESNSRVTAIFGASGSGKSTILNCVAGFLKPDDGFIQFGEDIFFSQAKNIDKPSNKRRIGYVTQDAGLFPHMSVRKNIEYGYKLTLPEYRKFSIPQLIDAIGLGSLLGMYPQTLSGGERQRVALARSLATSPQLLLLDEPLASIDLPSRGALIKLLKRAAHEFEIPMLHVSHSMTEVIALADRVVVISDGSVIDEGDPKILFKNPQFFSGANREIFENMIEGELIDTGGGGLVESVSVAGNVIHMSPIKKPTSSVVMISIRATDIIISRNMPAAISARNIICSRISGFFIQDDMVLIECDIGVKLLVEITRYSFEKLFLKKDMDVFLIIKSGNIVVFND